MEKAIKCNVFTGLLNDAIRHIYGSQDKLNHVLDLLSPVDVAETMLRKLQARRGLQLTFRYNAYRALIMGIRQQKRLPLWIQNFARLTRWRQRKIHESPPSLKPCADAWTSVYKCEHGEGTANDKSGRNRGCRVKYILPPPLPRNSC